ncbi:MAG: class I mannose-6-phosphate isomerase [Sphingomonadaceae bacterium]
MAALKLRTRRVEKVWGRRDLPPGFAPVPSDAPPVGEIWFEHPRDERPPLLVKYLFTSEKLSVQVHPGDELARAKGYAGGKDEAWLVLAAEPHAMIGLGLREVMTREELRLAALDGTIEDMLRWRAARAGDSYYTPAGTIHALGAGLALVEVQQNVDCTLRLHDYGRGRELHVDEAVEAAEPVPYVAPFRPYEAEPGREILADGPAFVFERWRRAGKGRLSDARRIWIVPVAGEGRIDGEALAAGAAWIAEDGCEIAFGEGADILFAYPGEGTIEKLVG